MKGEGMPASFLAWAWVLGATALYLFQYRDLSGRILQALGIGR